MAKTNKQFQRKFVKDVLGNIAKRIIYDIDRGAVPDDWNGLKLRWLIERAAQESASFPSMKKNGKEWRDFKNTCIINNL